MGALRFRSDRHAPRQSGRSPRPVLLTTELLLVLTAVPCGIFLIVNGLGMSKTVLDDSPFDSFLIPGLVLSLVVGGSGVAAAWMTWIRHPLSWLASFAAGGILFGWIVGEAAMVHDGRALQAIVLVFALLLIGLSLDEARVDRRF